MLAYLLQGLGYGFSAAVQPGPFQTYVISEALQRGWRRTLFAALAPLVSDGPIIALALLLLTQLPTGWERVLYVAGGLFALYLAWGAYRAWRVFDLIVPPSEAPPSEAPPPESPRSGVLQAALMNSLSPGPYLFWGLITGPVLLEGWRRAPIQGLGFLCGFYLAMVGSLAGLILLFSTARRLGPTVNRALVGISALALAAFGLLQLTKGLFLW
jgi:threonine/homoserine/homoserine lactone efflux protein